MGLFGPPNVEKMQARRNIEGLIKALGYPQDAGVRKRAAAALGELGDLRACEPLIAAFQDKDSEVRTAAESALGRIGDPHTAELLIPKLKDRNALVRQAAAEALGKVVARLEETALIARSIDLLIAALKDEAMIVQYAAEHGLKRIGVPAVDALLAELGDGKGKSAYSIISILGEIGDIRAVEPFISALKDNRNNAVLIHALEKIGDQRAVEPLIGELNKEGNHGWQALAARALGKISDLRAVEPLIFSLKTGNTQVRQDAATALGRLGDLRAIDPLIAALEADSQPGEYNLRSNIVGALGMIGDSRAVPVLIRMLQNASNSLPQKAAIALEQIRLRLGEPELRDRIGEVLIAALNDKDRAVRKTAAEVLGRMDDPRAVEPLSVLLSDKVWFVRKTAAEALVKIYQSGRLDASLKQFVLAKRDRITSAHADKEVVTYSGDCTEPVHTDNNGVGASFPI
jgi:HEAT repeat protein